VTQRGRNAEPRPPHRPSNRDPRSARRLPGRASALRAAIPWSRL